MSAIGGILQLNEKSLDPSALERMKQILTQYGRDTQQTWRQRSIGLTRTLLRITPEDYFDQQPLTGKESPFTLVADGRIDNRDELIDKLGLSKQDSRFMADSAIILHAFEQWGDNCVNHLYGDFAFAVWDRKQRRLFLARDHFGHRPLYWYKDKECFAFATMCKGIFTLPGIPKEVCKEQLIDHMALVPMTGAKSFFKGIYRIEPGHFLILQDGQIKTRCYHRLDPSKRIKLSSNEEYLEAFREHLEQAIQCRLRSCGGIGSHLSGGFDSSTITAIAARQLAERAKGITAYTAVPRKGFNGPVPEGRMANEGPVAATLAARFDNIEHILVHTGDHSSLSNMDDWVDAHGRPPLNPGNHVWISAIQQLANERKERVVLGGVGGNYSISWTGYALLHKLLCKGQFIRWLQEAVACCSSSSPLTWKGVLKESIGPFIPTPLWQLISRHIYAKNRQLTDYTAIPAKIIQEYAPHERAKKAGWNINYSPWTADKKTRTNKFYRQDRGDYFAAANALGVERRTPLIDLRLLEFCLAVPEEQYLHKGKNRWLLRRLMDDVLPEEILSCHLKGYQAADWYEGLQNAQPEIETLLQKLAYSETANEYFDIKRMLQLQKQLPLQHNWSNIAVIRSFRRVLLRGYSIGAFIRYMEEENQ